MKRSCILRVFFKIALFTLIIMPQISIADDWICIARLYEEAPKEVNLSFAEGRPVYIPNVSELPILDI